MHDIKFIEENESYAKDNLAKRGIKASVIDKVLELNSKRKELIGFVESKKASLKKLSKEIGGIKKSGGDASEIMSQVTALKEEMGSKEVELAGVRMDLDARLSEIPNFLDEDIPVGKDENDNEEVYRWGKIPEFSFVPKNHADLGEELGMVDFLRGAKITGARFVVTISQVARLERAISNFMLDFHHKNGLVEIIPPLIVNEDTMYASGQLPKFKEDLFKIEGRDWYLIPTAEVPLVSINRDEIVERSFLPRKICGYTPCFRSEAGSHGKDTRGLIRMHQFNKVEMIFAVAEEDSKKAHEEMVGYAKGILEAFELPYRVVKLCSGDTGANARKCYDLEVWLPSYNAYREISSVSNCGSFQARRANIRYRDNDGKLKFVHLLNGSGLAVGRTLLAIAENFQQEDGTIVIPKVLRPYMNGEEVITKMK